MLGMKPAIRRFHSPDVSDLASYEPKDPTAFGVLVQILVGPRDEVGEESFDVVVCSPKWLEAQLEAGEVRSVRHHLMTLQYDWPEIEGAMRKLVDECEAETWAEVALKLGRLGRWEFEDYTP